MTTLFNLQQLVCLDPDVVEACVDLEWCKGDWRFWSDGHWPLNRKSCDLVKRTNVWSEVAARGRHSSQTGCLTTLQNWKNRITS